MRQGLAREGPRMEEKQLRVLLNLGALVLLALLAGAFVSVIHAALTVQ